MTIKPNSIAVVGAAETTRLGIISDFSTLGLHLDAALNAMSDAGISPRDIDGLATAGEHPWNVSTMLGITPKWVDGTNVGGCSFMLHVRHAALATDTAATNTAAVLARAVEAAGDPDALGASG